jgi:carbon monoxide dehydrogenase subunit G
VIWAKLSDARTLADCVPGVESVARAEPQEVVCTIRPGLAFVRGTLEVTVRVVEAVPDTTLRYAVLSKGIGSSSEVEAVLALAPHDGGTRVHWTATVTQLGGLLKAVPQGLIRGAAEKVIADAWARVEPRVSG